MCTIYVVLYPVSYHCSHTYITMCFRPLPKMQFTISPWAMDKCLNNRLTGNFKKLSEAIASVS